MNTTILNELMKLAPKNDPRYYLRGVHVFSGDGKLFAEVTNGHYALRWCELYDGSPIDVIFCKESWSSYKWGKDIAITGIDGNCERVAIQLGHNEVVYVDKIDGRFPDIDRIIPDENASIAPRSYDGDYLASVQKAWRAIASDRKAVLHWQQYENRPALAMGETIQGALMALISPLRNDAPTISRQWFKSKGDQ